MKKSQHLFTIVNKRRSRTAIFSVKKGRRNAWLNILQKIIEKEPIFEEKKTKFADADVDVR